MTTFEIVTILFGTGIIFGIGKIIFNTGKISEKITLMDKNINQLQDESRDILKSIQILDSRISRIEGQLTPRIWEPRIIEKKEE
jgi:peptidoglycan hydrolase CwlO-like protein